MRSQQRPWTDWFYGSQNADRDWPKGCHWCLSTFWHLAPNCAGGIFTADAGFLAFSKRTCLPLRCCRNSCGNWANCKTTLGTNFHGACFAGGLARQLVGCDRGNQSRRHNHGNYQLAAFTSAVALDLLGNQGSGQAQASKFVTCFYPSR